MTSTRPTSQHLSCLNSFIAHNYPQKMNNVIDPILKDRLSHSVDMGEEMGGQKAVEVADD